MVGDFLLGTLKLLIVIGFIPFEAIHVDVTGLTTVFSLLINGTGLFSHIFFLPLMFQYFLAWLTFEAGLFAITAYLKARGIIRGDANMM